MKLEGFTKVPGRIRHYMEVIHFVVLVTGIIAIYMVIRNTEVNVTFKPRVEVVEISSPIVAEK